MAKPIAQLSKLTVFIMYLIIIACLNCMHAHKHDQSSTWAKTVAYGHQRKTSLHFYCHVIASGSSPSFYQIAQASSTNMSTTGFGTLYMVDEPLTVGPELESKLVGRAQGLYGLDSQKDFSLIMALSYSLSDGICNGSSLSILGQNPVIQPVRETAVVGGTGVFRMARGYAVLHKYWSNATTGDVIVGYNVTVVHS